MLELRCWLDQGAVERRRNFVLRRSDDYGDGTSCGSVEARTTRSESSRCFIIWTRRCSTSDQQSRDSSSSERLPSLIDVKGHGRPKEVSGTEEDSQQWSKTTEACVAGVIKESEMILEWAAEQPTEISTTAIVLEFLPTDTNAGRGVQNMECVLQQMHSALVALMSSEANDIVANSRKNPLVAWRRLQKRYDPTTGGREPKLSANSISLGRCSLLELQAGLEAWESREEEVQGQIGRRDQPCRS